MASRSGRIEVIDPTTEEVIGSMAEATGRDAEEAAAAARAAQPGWAAMDPQRRAEIFSRVAVLVSERAEALTELSMREGGFTRSMAGGFAVRADEWFTAAEATVRSLDVATPPQLPQARRNLELLNGQIQRRPVGVVAALIPFNGPLFGAAMKSAQALAMGNTVVLKPAPQNPLAVVELFKIFEEAGMPPGVANLVTAADTEVGATLTRSPNVDLVRFTGSTAVGRAVYGPGPGYEAHGAGTRWQGCLPGLRGRGP